MLTFSVAFPNLEPCRPSFVRPSVTVHMLFGTPFANLFELSVFFSPATATEDEPMVPKVWSAIDDFQLKEGVQSRVIFPSMVKSGTWSVRWTASELQARWRAVLYDPLIADEAARHIASVKEKRRRAKFSDSELKLLEKVKTPEFEGYVALFEQNRQVWHPSRTLSMIEAQGKTIKRAAGFDENAPVLKKSSARLKVEAPPKTPRSSTSKKPQEEAIVIPSPPKHHPADKYHWSDHPHVLAVLVGERIMYEVTTTPVIIGRRALTTPGDQELHVNLADEGDASRISRSQAIIEMDSNHSFTIRQTGKATTLMGEVDLRDKGSVPLPDRCTLVFSQIEMEWIAKP